MKMVLITIEYFGPAKKFTSGKSTEGLELKDKSGTTLNSVLTILSEKYSKEFVDFIIKDCGIALNEEYLTIDREGSMESITSKIKLFDGDDIVIVPPVSSG